MDIRRLVGIETQQALYVWSQSFERGDRAMEDWKEWEERIPSGRTTYGIYDGDALQAAFLLVDEAIHFGDAPPLPMGAVCGVGVLPASRGKGYASRGVSFLFERMRDKGQSISFLEPFSWEFYGRLGYAWTAPSARYSVPTRCLKPSPETDYVRAMRMEGRDAVIACYTKFAAGYRGMVARRREVWDWTFDGNKKEYTYTYVYERDGAVEGYLMYHGGKRDETRIEEFIAHTARARLGLLGLLRRHDMQITKFRWDGPVDDPFWSILVHGDIETKLYSRTMARIVDVGAAIEAIRIAGHIRGSVRLAVIDPTAPWNQRTWRITCEGGRAMARPAPDAPQITITIQALSQAYLGSPTMSQLRDTGHIQVHDETGFDMLAAVLAGPPAWCNDGF